MSELDLSPRELADRIGELLPDCHVQWWKSGKIQITTTAEAVKSLLLAMGQKGHVAEFGATEFSLEHPLACRAAGLLNCELHRVCSALDASPVALPGRYLVDLLDGELVVLGPEEVTG